MSPQQEEDYELVLGNRQLFFLAVVLFGVFFSIGYTVGYSRGRESSDVVTAQGAPLADPEAPRSAPPTVPAVEPAAGGNSPAKSSEAVYSSAAGVSKPTSRQPAKSPAQAAAPQARDSATTTAVKSEPLARNNSAATPASLAPGGTPRSTTVPSASKVREAAPVAPRAEAPPAHSPKPSSSTAADAPTPTLAVPAIEPGTIYLQVLASREAEPARKSLLEFKSKGHPVTLDNQDPDWYRILVGPFSTREAADAYQARLQAEGIKSFLRRF